MPHYSITNVLEEVLVRWALGAVASFIVGRVESLLLDDREANNQKQTFSSHTPSHILNVYVARSPHRQIPNKIRLILHSKVRTAKVLRVFAAPDLVYIAKDCSQVVPCNINTFYINKIRYKECIECGYSVRGESQMHILLWLCEK